MKIKTLRQTHDSYDADRWSELDALSKGGKAFHSKLSVFLPKNPAEPAPLYHQRKANAHYHSYMGSIINLYVSWLFAANFSIKPYERDTDIPISSPEAFYGRLQENVGGETTLTNFIKDRFREAMTKQCAYWLIELPSNEGAPPNDKAEYEQRGLGNAMLTALDCSEVLDWQYDKSGELSWAIVWTKDNPRATPESDRAETVETWRIYDRVNVTTYEIRYQKGKKPSDTDEITPTVPATPHGFKRVPIITLDVKQELCVGEQTRDAQVEHFRLDNGLSWLIRRTCYAQPLFKVEDGDRLPTMGAGYAIVIGPEDEMSWTSPPTAPFDVLQKNVDAKRDDIYRIVHQMAQAVDNNAETVGRSADSKEIDAAATRIMLNAYGSTVSEAIENTLETISEARGEDNYEWSVEGFAGYDTATAASLLANIQLSRTLGIPSKTFHKEVTTKAALAILPEVDQRVKDTIRHEIENANFEVSSQPLEAEAQKALSDLNKAKAEAEPIKTQSKSALEDAKAKAEPIKAQASMKSASRPQPSPGANGAAGKK